MLLYCLLSVVIIYTITNTKKNLQQIKIQQKVHSDIVSSRNVSEEKVFDLRDVHGLFDGGVSTADLQETTFQCVLTDHHSEKHSHLIIPKIMRHRDTHGYISPQPEKQCLLLIQH